MDPKALETLKELARKIQKEGLHLYNTASDMNAAIDTKESAFYQDVFIGISDMIRAFGQQLQYVIPDLEKTSSLKTADSFVNKVFAPGHGFNSERSQRAENGGRP